MAARGSALKVLFKIDAEYAVGSEKHYTFCYLADPFVNGPARSDFNKGMKLSAMKRMFENQYGDEAIPLMCMILLACGDSNSSDQLKKYAPSQFAGEKVKEEKRIAYNLRCLFVSIANKLDSKSRDNMIELLQEELQTRESAGTKFQTVLLLLERFHQASIILPEKLTQLEEWLGITERDDLIKLYINEFDPNKRFPGMKLPGFELATGPGV
jgi:hypothetical protein